MQSRELEGMKRALLSFAFLSLFVHGCTVKEDAVHGVTGATPRVLEAADARGWPETVPEEDGSAWPDGPPQNAEHNTFKIMSASAAKAYIEAYTDKKSYLPGETIHFHVSTNAETYSILIRREGWTRTTIAKVTDLPGVFYPVPPHEEQPCHGCRD